MSGGTQCQGPIAGQRKQGAEPDAEAAKLCAAAHGSHQKLLHPYAKCLVSSIGRHVQELQHRVASGVAVCPMYLSHCVQALSHKLTLKAQSLHMSIQQNLEQMREELNGFSQIRCQQRELGAGSTPGAVRRVAPVASGFPP